MSLTRKDFLTPFDMFSVLKKYQKVLCLSAILGATCFLVLGYMLGPKFVSTARILPPQQQASSGAMLLGQLSGVAAGLAAGGVSLKNPSDIYVAMLQSDSVRNNIIEKFNLKSVFDVKTMFDARKKLESIASVSSTKEGIIVINVQSSDPNFSANMANEFVRQLDGLNRQYALTDASKARLFFEKRLTETKKQLNVAELNYQRVQKSKGIIQPESQISGFVAGMEELRAQIRAKEIELASIRSFSTSENPSVVLLNNTISSMKQQLAKMEGPANVSDDLSHYSDGVLLHLRAYRELKYQEALFDLLSKQFEAARLDEARESSVIQVLDKALPADKSTQYELWLFGLMGGLAFYFGAFILIILRSFSGLRESYAKN